MLKYFRVISLVEGLSFLLLLFVAMPAKYILGYPLAVTVMGWTHGLLFIAYVYMASKTSDEQQWTDGYFFLILLAGMLPFACFFLEYKLRKELRIDSV